mmetsp:Transcript_5911/g.9620  ORF Transcript_5911/g.9620 Transcript_5911/m.9620 type:complete len:462 (+) Transcript_5911:1172-2557(+)
MDRNHTEMALLKRQSEQPKAVPRNFSQTRARRSSTIDEAANTRQKLLKMGNTKDMGRRSTKMEKRPTFLKTVTKFFKMGSKTEKEVEAKIEAAEKMNKLQKELKNMVKTNIKKQERIDYLWKRARFFAKNGARFVNIMKQKTQHRMAAAQEGTTAYAQFFMAHSDGDGALGGKWKCRIQIDSSFFFYWELVFACNMLLVFFLMPLLYSAYNLDLYLILEERGIELVVLKLACWFNILDIGYNLIREHQITETEATVYLRDSVALYLKKNGVFDLISNSFAIWVLFVDPRLLKHIIFSWWLEYVEHYSVSFTQKDVELVASFEQRFFPAYASQDSEQLLEGHREQDTFLGMTFWTLFALSRAFVFIKVTNFNRLLRFIRKFKELVDSTQADKQLQKNIWAVLTFVQIMMRILLLIHFVTCFWMAMSQGVFVRFGHVLFKHLEDTLKADDISAHLGELSKGIA